MAIYHLSVKPISRAGGRSATAAAAYRSGELVHDKTSGETFDYTRRRGVETTEIVLPTEAAKQDINWARDRQTLWNAAESAENRSNSRVAREYELALPHELTKGQRKELVWAFSKEIADRYGVAVDFAIHSPHRHGDERNHHAHVLTTTRVVEAGGLGEKSQIEWSDANRRKAGLGPAKDEITFIRERWATLTNEHLQERGIEARVDHRSLEAQGIEREPQSHLGPAVSGMERRGIETQVGKRLEAEALQAAQERLEKASEFGKTMREREEVSRSILDVSGDLEGAKRERDLLLLRQKQLTQKPQSLEQIRAQARENWLAMRAEQQSKAATEKTPDQAAEQAPEKSQGHRLTLDEQRKEAAEHWVKYRREQLQNPSASKEPERGQQQGPEVGPSPKGRDGPEIE